jgi:hypothetical protein
MSGSDHSHTVPRVSARCPGAPGRSRSHESSRSMTPTNMIPGPAMSPARVWNLPRTGTSRQRLSLGSVWGPKLPTRMSSDPTAPHRVARSAQA